MTIKNAVFHEHASETQNIMLYTATSFFERQRLKLLVYLENLRQQFVNGCFGMKMKEMFHDMSLILSYILVIKIILLLDFCIHEMNWGSYCFISGRKCGFLNYVWYLVVRPLDAAISSIINHQLETSSRYHKHNHKARIYWPSLDHKKGYFADLIYQRERQKPVYDVIDFTDTVSLPIECSSDPISQDTNYNGYHHHTMMNNVSCFLLLERLYSHVLISQIHGMIPMLQHLWFRKLPKT